MYVRPVLGLLLLGLGSLSQPARAAGTPEALTYLQMARERYRSLSTYQDNLRISIQVKVTDEEGEGQEHHHTFDRSFRYARTNRFVLNTKEANIRSDGHTRWTEILKSGQYVENPAGSRDDLAEDLKDGPVHIQFHPHPVGGLLLRPEARLEEVFPTLQAITNLSEETRDGVPYQKLSGELVSPWSDDAPLPVELWFRAADGLLTDLHIDGTRAYQQMIDQQFENQQDAEEDSEEDGEPVEDPQASTNRPRVEVYAVDFSFRDMVTEAPLPDDLFVFKPGTNHQKVARFRQPRSRPSEQMKLIGQPAPDISGTGLDGQPLALADLRGRVVLLDFWATWCGPCVAALPHVQKTAEQFAGQPVTFLGINRDGPDSDEKVRRFLEKKKITFRQFMDREGEVASAYKVNGIPCQVLIDTNGIIRDITVGFSPDGEEALAEKLRLVLAGNPVYSAEELAELTSEEPEMDEADLDPAEEEDPVFTNAVLEEVRADELTAGKREANISISSYYARTHDLDGDGSPELILPSWQRGLYLLSSDGTAVTRVNLKGRGPPYSMNGCLPVPTTNGVHWLAHFTRWNNHGDESSSVLDYFTPDGQRVWSYAPAMPAGLQAEYRTATGDLDADGTPELVVATSLYRRQKMQGNSYRHINQRAYITILDQAGQIRCTRNAALRSVDYVWISAPATNGAGRTLIVLGDGRLQRFHFTPGPVGPGSATP